MARIRVLASLLLLATGCTEDPITPAEKTPEPIDSPEAVVRALSRSYQNRDLGLFKSILAHDTRRNASYLFFLSEPENQWGYDEEVKIQRRMFNPEVHVTAEPPVPNDLWLSSITIHLTRLDAFAEIPDLYSNDQGQDGKLDPALWKAVGARYDTEAFFDTASDLDYYVRSEARFVVIEDLAKHVGDPGKFLLYEWDDASLQLRQHAGEAPATSSKGWSEIKSLYR